MKYYKLRVAEIMKHIVKQMPPKNLVTTENKVAEIRSVFNQNVTKKHVNSACQPILSGIKEKYIT